MGVVYLCRDLQLARDVALKLSLPTAADRGDRSLVEAQTMARLNHPNVIAVYEVGKTLGRLFIAMEHVDGGTLQAWLDGGGHSWRQVLDRFREAARGLAAAHAAGLVHRDFKPGNVLVGRDGRVRVADFGLALAAGQK